MAKKKYNRDITSPFGRHLRKYRREHKMSIRAFAEIMGVSKSTASRIERGEQDVPIDYIPKIQARLDDPPDLAKLIFDRSRSCPRISLELVGKPEEYRNFAYILKNFDPAHADILSVFGMLYFRYRSQGALAFWSLWPIVESVISNLDWEAARKLNEVEEQK